MEEQLTKIADELYKYKFRNSEKILVPVQVMVKALEDSFKKGDRTEEIIKLIDERIKYCESKLIGNFQEEKIWKWRIEGFRELLKKIRGEENRSSRDNENIK